MAIYSLDGRQPLLPDGFCFVADSAQVIGHVILGEGPASGLAPFFAATMSR
jgi:carbonic anhydrase/acetyltransferase-like protein (isoleucine patch superfamily)